MRTVIVNGDALTVADVVDVAFGAARAELGPEVQARMETTRAVVAAAIAGGGPVYGVNTGFGALADTRVGERDLTALQGAIVRSHAAATGEPLDDPTVRAILLLRARTLAAGLLRGPVRRCRSGCLSCWRRTCCRSCQARARWAHPVTWPSWRTSRSR